MSVINAYKELSEFNEAIKLIDGKMNLDYKQIKESIKQNKTIGDE